MAADATPRRFDATVVRPLVYSASALAIGGVFLRWTADGPVKLDGVSGPNNGWLVVLAAAFAAAWARSLAKGSLFAVVGVSGAALVICWTAVENWLDARRATEGGASYGLFLVVAAGLLLAGSAVVAAVDATRRPRVGDAAAS